MTIETLRNGATILKRKKGMSNYLDVILAITDNNEFVTWIQNLHDKSLGYDGTFHGGYFGQDLQKALNDFNDRG